MKVSRAFAFGVCYAFFADAVILEKEFNIADKSPSFYPSVSIEVNTLQKIESNLAQYFESHDINTAQNVGARELPSINPSTTPSKIPTSTPSVTPIGFPTSSPSTTPSAMPSTIPSSFLTSTPSQTPSGTPSISPSMSPSITSSEVPSTLSLSFVPSIALSSRPSLDQSYFPSVKSISEPTTTPSNSPSVIPSNMPTSTPSVTPSNVLTGTPSITPSNVPTNTPSTIPSNVPTNTPSTIPSEAPTSSPSTTPSVTSLAPSTIPSIFPSFSSSEIPSLSLSSIPSVATTSLPTNTMSSTPSMDHSNYPSTASSYEPTKIPSTSPSTLPNLPSNTPMSTPTRTPSMSLSSSPSIKMTTSPSISRTLAPQLIASVKPLSVQSNSPSLRPISNQLSRLTLTSVRLTDITQYMNEQSIVPLFESVTKKFIVDYMYRGTTLDEGVIVEIDGVAVQKQSLGPNYLYIEFIIYGNVSPASQETGKIFEKAALNGLTFYFTEYVTVLNESDEFFDIREGDGQSLLFENDDVTGSGSDDSGIDSVKKNLVIVFVVGSLVIVLVLAFLRNSNKELRKKRWNLYESRGELPTHCLADDTMNIEGISTTYDDDSEIPYGIDLSPAVLQQVYEKENQVTLNIKRNVSFSPHVVAKCENSQEQVEPMKSCDMNDDIESSRNNNKSIVKNNGELEKEDDNAKSFEESKEQEEILGEYIELKYSDPGIDDEGDEADDVDDLVGEKVMEEFMASPMPPKVFAMKSEGEAGIQVHQLNKDEKNNVDEQKSIRAEGIENFIGENQEVPKDIPHLMKSQPSHDTGERMQMTQMVGGQYNTEEILPTMSEGSDALHLCQTEDSSTVFAEVNPTMSSMTDYDFGGRASIIRYRDTEPKVREQLITVRAPNGPLGLIIGSTPHGPIVQLIKASSPLLGEVHIGDIILRVDEIVTDRMSSAKLTGVMTAKRNQRERKLLLLRK